MSDSSWPAARFLGPTGSLRAVRGNLELTGSHLKFRPAGIAARVEGTPFAVQLKHIVGAGVVEARGGVFRRQRARLCITLGDGSEQTFGVTHPDEVAEAVRRRLGERA